MTITNAMYMGSLALSTRYTKMAARDGNKKGISETPEYIYIYIYSIGSNHPLVIKYNLATT